MVGSNREHPSHDTLRIWYHLNAIFKHITTIFKLPLFVGIATKKKFVDVDSLSCMRQTEAKMVWVALRLSSLGPLTLDSSLVILQTIPKYG